MAILQEHAPTLSTVMPQLRAALASRVIVEQAKGFLRELFDVPIEEAFHRAADLFARQRRAPHRRGSAADERSARPPGMFAAISEFAMPPTH